MPGRTGKCSTEPDGMSLPRRYLAAILEEERERLVVVAHLHDCASRRCAHVQASQNGITGGYKG